MSNRGRFGNITKKKVVSETKVVEVPVKGWRARLVEWLLKKDIETLENELKKQEEERFRKEVLEAANDILRSFQDDYERQLDNEILEELNMYKLQFSTEYAGDDVFGVAENLEFLETTEIRDISTPYGYLRIPKRFVRRKDGSSLKQKLDNLAKEFELPDITTWKQGRFIDQPRYKRMGRLAKETHDSIEKTLIRPGGGTNNALFRVTNTHLDQTIPQYLEKLGNILRKELGD